MAAGLENMVDPGDLTAVKVHFGEVGNDAFVSPIHVADIVKEIEKTGAKSSTDRVKVMGAAMKELSGRADGKEISAIVKELLQ